MNIKVRQEQPQDYPIVEKVVEAAFADEKMSDQSEHLLVARLRKSKAFVPELSLVAETNGQIVGHILLTKIQIKNDTRTYPSLALAPVSVLPEFQRKGIGSKLILKAHEAAQAVGFQSIILLGHADYYPRFGYERTSRYGIRLPFPAPEENCMVLGLQPEGLEGVSGEVIYPKAFF